MPVGQPKIVTAAEWDQARAELLLEEKRLTRAEDAVAAQRRRLPMVQFRTDYAFTGPDGPLTLLDLFDSRSQLVLYQFMDVGPDQLCPGCTWFTHSVPPNGVDQLADADVSWATVSDMPIEQMRSPTVAKRPPHSTTPHHQLGLRTLCR